MYETTIAYKTNTTVYAMGKISHCKGFWQDKLSPKCLYDTRNKGYLKLHAQEDYNLPPTARIERLFLTVISS